MRQQSFGELRQPEEVAFLRQALDRIAASWTAASLEKLGLGDEKLVDRAVPALVRCLIKVSAAGAPLAKPLGGPLGALFRGANEVVVRNIQQAGQSAEFCGDPIRELPGIETCFLRAPLDLLTML